MLWWHLPERMVFALRAGGKWPPSQPGAGRQPNFERVLVHVSHIGRDSRRGSHAGVCIPPSLGELMTRAILLGLLVAGVFSLHGYAAEPDGSASLINAKEALRIEVQGLLATKA